MDSGQKDSFLDELRHFLASIGKIHPMHPVMDGKFIDLHDLYNKVIANGGHKRVSKDDMWHDLVLEIFGKTSDTMCYGLRNIYLKYLDAYEKVNFHGEEHQEQQTRFQRGHHGYSSSSRYGGGSSRFKTGPSRGGEQMYRKLQFSLMSCLPNEVDFAINSCTLISSESAYFLHLSRNKALLDSLLLHAGVVSDGPDSLRGVCEEFKNKSGHDFEKFWRDTVKNKHILERVFNDVEIPENSAVAAVESAVASSAKDDEKYDAQLFFRPVRAEGIQDYEGQRILQIAMVLLNLSFEHFNATLIAKSKSARNFMLLLLHSTYSELRQTGFDLLANLSLYIDLHMNRPDMNAFIYRFIIKCVNSQDKLEIARGFETLGNLCRRESNLNLLCVHLCDSVLVKAKTCLLLPDLELLHAALELLYRLSKMPAANDICTRLALLPYLIDILVGYVSFNVSSFKGYEYFKRIRLARKLPAHPNHQAAAVQQQKAHHQQRPPPSYHHHQQQQQQMRMMVPTPPPSRHPHHRPHPTVATAPHAPQAQFHMQAAPTRNAFTSPPPPSTPQRYPPPPSPAHQPQQHPRHRPPFIMVRPQQQQQQRHPQGATMALSRPSDAGPTYTQSDHRFEPPHYHYMPAPPANIKPDQSADSFARLCRAPTPNAKSSAGADCATVSTSYEGVQRRQTTLPVPYFKMRDDKHNSTGETPKSVGVKRTIEESDSASVVAPDSRKKAAPNGTLDGDAVPATMAPPAAKRLKTDDNHNEEAEKNQQQLVNGFSDSKKNGQVQPNSNNTSPALVVDNKSTRNNDCIAVVGNEGDKTTKACQQRLEEEVVANKKDDEILENGVDTIKKLLKCNITKHEEPAAVAKTNGDHLDLAEKEPSSKDKSEKAHSNNSNVVTKRDNDKTDDSNTTNNHQNSSCNRLPSPTSAPAPQQSTVNSNTAVNNNAKPIPFTPTVTISQKGPAAQSTATTATAPQGTNQTPSSHGGVNQPIMTVPFQQLQQRGAAMSRAPNHHHVGMLSPTSTSNRYPTPPSIQQHHHYHQRQQQASGGRAGGGMPAIDLMAPNASWQVLHRNCGKFEFANFTDQYEDSLTISIRLTAVLTLTNIAEKSEVGRSCLLKHKEKLIECTFSTMDCSARLAQLLYIISH